MGDFILIGQWALCCFGNCKHVCFETRSKRDKQQQKHPTEYETKNLIQFNGFY